MTDAFLDFLFEWKFCALDTFCNLSSTTSFSTLSLTGQSRPLHRFFFYIQIHGAVNGVALNRVVLFLEASFASVLVNYFTALALSVHTSNPSNPTLGLGRAFSLFLCSLLRDFARILFHRVFSAFY
jgi:hypothetical protein